MKTINWTMVSIDTLVLAGAPGSSYIMKSILYFASRNQCGAMLFEIARSLLPAMSIRIKRVYDEPEADDGTRILVDRLWPRGLTKEKARVDLWLKDVAPSTKLRKWFAHDPAKWTEFQARYREELKKGEEQISLLKQEAAKGTITLVYGAKDQQHNEAVVLQRLLDLR
jgi:uncharacterized protein YeaO (DUF488 family)